MSDQPPTSIWQRIDARLRENPLLLVYGGAAGFAVLVVAVILVLVLATGGGGDGETVSGDPTGQSPSPAPTSTPLATSPPLVTFTVTPSTSPTTTPTATPDGPLPSFAPPSDEPTLTPSPSPTPGETPAPTPPPTGILAPGVIAVEPVLEFCVQPADDEPIQCSYTLQVSTDYEVSALPAQIECRIRSQVPAFSQLEPDTVDISKLSGLVTVSPRAVAQFDPPDIPRFSLPTLVECFLQVPQGGGFRNLDSVLVEVSLPAPEL